MMVCQYMSANRKAAEIVHLLDLGQQLPWPAEEDLLAACASLPWCGRKSPGFTKRRPWVQGQLGPVCSVVGLSFLIHVVAVTM
jgi:hypothetical protein